MNKNNTSNSISKASAEDLKTNKNAASFSDNDSDDKENNSTEIKEEENAKQVAGKKKGRALSAITRKSAKTATKKENLNLKSVNEDKNIQENDKSDSADDESEVSECNTSDDKEVSEVNEPVVTPAVAPARRRSAGAVSKEVIKSTPQQESVKKSRMVVAGKKTAKELETILFDFMRTKSRPYPISELISTFKTSGGKTEISKAMEKLAEKGSLMKKQFGNKLLYFNFKEESKMEASEIESLKEECENITSDNAMLSKEIKEANKEISELLLYPKNEELQDAIKGLLREIDENKERISDLRDGKIKVNKEDMTRVDQELSKYKKILKERKAIYKNIFDTLLENCGMNKNQLMEEIGLEE